MPNEALTTELLLLLEALCEDRLTPDETARLEQLVMSSAEARWYYLSYVDLHGSLYWDAAGVGSATALSSDELPVWSDVAQPAITLAPALPAARKSTRSWRVIAAASTAACLCVTAIWWFAANGPVKPNQIAKAPGMFPEAKGVHSRSASDDVKNATVQRLHGSPVNIEATNSGSAETLANVVVTPQTPTVPAPPEPPREVLDSHDVITAVNTEIRRGWEIADVKPSSVADDTEWLRRVSLDLIGRIPTVDEAEQFLASKRSGKREELIDRLLDDSAYARNLTTIWTNLLVGRRSERLVDRGALQKFLRMSFAANRPWNQIVYDLVAAEGNNTDNGATNFLIAHLNNDALPATAVTARVFLGQHVQCNQCHNNPFSKTYQTAFWELHSFFSQTASVPRHERDPRTGKEHYAYTELVTRDAGGPIYFEMQNGLMRVAYPRFNGQEVDPSPETNRRAALARLMTEGDQPQLAAAFVNRLWSHFFGEGFTPVVDDIGSHSPSSHPELLDLLSRQFVRSGYDVKQLVRWICNSEPYQLSSRFGDANQSDEPIEGQLPHFSRMYVKSMTAEQMYDSFLIATKAHRAGGVDWTQAEQQRQNWLSQFVVNYETDENDECMQFDGTMSQALTLMNGPLIEKALEISPGTFLDEVVRQKIDEKEKIRRLCVAVLSRPPSTSELVSMRKLVREDSAGRGSKNAGRSVANGEGYQDLFWALLNSNEFSLVH